MEHCKLVIVDLDGTLWDGILLEDGIGGLSPRADMVATLRALDQRGILLSIVSKNHPEDALAALEEFGLADLFVFPQITWDPKSDAVKRILKSVRFSPAHAVFVDDTAYERELVRAMLPDIGVTTPEELPSLATAPALTGHRTEESGARKRFYRDEELRQQAEAEHEGAYRSFLQEIGLEIRVGPANERCAERVAELVQRTNQINFSNNRYDQEQVRALLESARHRCFVVSAQDRFGPYGIIGFASIRDDGDGSAFIQDLMLSCRIQGRGVESALIATLAKLMSDAGHGEIVGLYRGTARNTHIANVYSRLGFTPVELGREGHHFSLDLTSPLPQAPSHVRVVHCDDVSAERNEGIPFVRRIVEDLVKHDVVSGKIIDVGAGWDGVLGEDCDQWLTRGENSHIRLDQETYPRTDIVANAQHMPDVDTDAFDSLLCLEVLEHCTNPFELSREILRVLRPGGAAVISAPMNYVIHEHPGDYWRFTPDGLKMLLNDGADVIREDVEGDPEHPVRTVLTIRKR
ncbi:MAG: hypothetical protein CME06_12730 [Gemmatimonadetes bacterium]|nr:hypothetical protein [Gemmatimonadota bacterium]